MKSSMLVRFGCPAILLAGCANHLPAGTSVALSDGYQPIGRPATAMRIPSATTPVTPELMTVPPGAREKVVKSANALIGKKGLVVDDRAFSSDCTGLVRAAYSTVGIDPAVEGVPGENGVSAIWRFSSRHGRTFFGGRPLPGDLVFFRETYDRNRDGRSNDGLTHIGLVERVEVDGTVQILHRVAQGVVRYRMNLGYPDDSLSRAGARVNDWLRSGGPNSTPRLTSQLFAGYATLLPVESELGGDDAPPPSKKLNVARNR
jgi:hypothetical protein